MAVSCTQKVGEEDADRVSGFAMRWNVLQCCGV